MRISNAGVLSRTGLNLFPLLPGVLISIAIGALAVFADTGIISPIFVALIIGLVLGSVVRMPEVAKPGLTFTIKRIMRLAVIMLGFKITLQQIAELGLVGIAMVVCVVIMTFFFTKAMARVLGVDRKLGELIAVGTSICGASAIVASNAVTRGSDEDVAYAIACITLFGTLAMFALPLADTILALEAKTYGLWAGTTIHEVGQVVAAAFQGGDTSGEFGTIAKLTRVSLLAPLILGLSLARGSSGGTEQSGGGVQIPWFVVAFLAAVVVNSTFDIPPVAHDTIGIATTILLSAALAAVGLETHFTKVRAKGWRPLLLGATSWLFIMLVGLALILWLGM